MSDLFQRAERWLFEAICVLGFFFRLEPGVAKNLYTGKRKSQSITVVRRCPEVFLLFELVCAPFAKELLEESGQELAFLKKCQHKLQGLTLCFRFCCPCGGYLTGDESSPLSQFFLVQGRPSKGVGRIFHVAAQCGRWRRTTEGTGFAVSASFLHVKQALFAFWQSEIRVFNLSFKHESWMNLDTGYGPYSKIQRGKNYSIWFYDTFGWLPKTTNCRSEGTSAKLWSLGVYTF